MNSMQEVMDNIHEPKEGWKQNMAQERILRDKMDTDVVYLHQNGRDSLYNRLDPKMKQVLHKRFNIRRV